MKLFALLMGLVIVAGCSDDSAAGGSGSGGTPSSGGSPPEGGAPTTGGEGVGGEGGDPGPAKLVFVTSTTSDGVLGGLVGGDAICQGLADDAGLGGTWMAWLSESVGESPSTRFTQATIPYRVVGGEPIAADWAALIDGTLDAPIDRDETGAVVADEIPVWTGTSPNGTPVTPCCEDWTSTASGSGNGVKTATDGTWSFNGGMPCTNVAHLYCFEQ